jgi:hypothetical protein
MRVADQARKVGDRLAEERENVDIESAQRQIDSLLSTVTRHIMPLIRDLQSGPNAERTLGKAYSPEYLEPILRIEAAIDARIDKTLGRRHPLGLALVPNRNQVLGILKNLPLGRAARSRLLLRGFAAPVLHFALVESHGRIAFVVTAVSRR